MLTGKRGADAPDRSFRFALPGGGCIEVHDSTVFKARYGWVPPELPCFAGAEIRFSDRARAAKFMEGNGVPIQREGDERYVAAQHANGFVLKLSQ